MSKIEFKYYGQFNKPVDQLLHEHYFIGVENGTCMECGAVDGVNLSSTKFFEETLHWNCYNIEANPVSFKKLEVNRPKATNVNVALSNKEGEALFKHGPRYFLRSKIVTKKEKDNLEYITIPTTTYSNIIKNNSIDHLDLFVLDVEGHELNVLKNLCECSVQPDVLVIEHHAGRKNIEALIGDLYKFDFSKRVNSFYTKK